MVGKSHQYGAGADALLQPENSSKKYETLFVEIDSGQIKLPMFQREFVWDKEKSARLIDSILKGYPIGTFILWKTREALRAVKDIGNHSLPSTPKGDYAQFILDGQQRITSLYAIRKGIRITRDGKEVDYRDIYIDLDRLPGDEGQVVTIHKVDGRSYLSVHEMLSGKLSELFSRAPGREEVIEGYRAKLTTYDFPTVTIRDYPIDIACEVFARINTGGKPLTLFEIMVAMTYDEEAGFDLAKRYEELLNGSDDGGKCLSDAGFGTIPANTILQAVAAVAKGSVRGKDILKMSRAEFIASWTPMTSAVFAAVDFIRENLRVPVSQLLPYPALIVPLSYFFHRNGKKKVSEEKARLLRQFFYWVGWHGRYSGSTESLVGEDLRRMEEIASGRAPRYPLDELFADPEEMSEIHFSTGASHVKAVLCLLAAETPKSFENGGVVTLDNSYLKIASSRNYHHFFPKAFVAKKFPGLEPNLLANITLIDAGSNNNIGAKPPSKYVAALRKVNARLPSALRSHLIDIKTFGLETDDYELFVTKRCAALAAKMTMYLQAEAET